MLRFAAATVAALLVPLGAAAQGAYPSQPVRFVVPLAAGGPTDTVARAVGEKMSAVLGVPVVVENRAGAGGQIAFDAVARAKPDGYTLLVMTSGHPLLPYASKSFTASLEKDLTPVSHFFSGSVAFTASHAVPVKTMQEFVAYAKANPGKLNYAGQGISDVFGNELFKSMTGIRAETVRYKGGAPAVIALVAGEAHYTFASPGAVKGHVESGKARILATTGLKRSAALPEIPTIAETVAPGYEYVYWVGLAGPANLPATVVEKLRAAASGALNNEEVRTRLATLGYEVANGGPADLARIISADLAKWKKVAEQSGIQPQ